MADFKDDDMGDEEKTQMINGLGYRMPAEASVAVKRTHANQFPQKSTYEAGEEIIVDFNTGSSFVDAHRSWINLTVTATNGAIAPDSISWGDRGSVMNIIQRVVVSTKSGVELARLENANLYYAKQFQYDCSMDFRTNYADTLGLAKRDYAGNAIVPNPLPAPPATANAPFTTWKPVFLTSGTAYHYTIPLALICGFFKGDGQTLIPPQIAAGLRLSITLAPSSTALYAQGTGDVSASYSVSKLTVQTSITTLTDDWQRKLVQISAEQGLVYPYTEVHTTSSTLTAAQTSVNIQVRKSVARCLSAFVVPRASSHVSGIKFDSMKSTALQFTSFQARLGSLYVPQQPVSANSELYYLAQNMVGHGIQDFKMPNGVTFTGFTTSSSDQDNGDCVFPVSLERSDIALNGVLNLSGLPTNNSRSLDVDITFSTALDRTNTLFMKHIKIARAFLENVVVSE